MVGSRQNEVNTKKAPHGTICCAKQLWTVSLEQCNLTRLSHSFPQPPPCRCPHAAPPPPTQGASCHSIMRCDVSMCDWTQHAVQVVEQQVPGEEPVHSHLCEAQLTDRLIHPNIAITHKTISRSKTVRLTRKVMALRPRPHHPHTLYRYHMHIPALWLTQALQILTSQFLAFCSLTFSHSLTHSLTLIWAQTTVFLHQWPCLRGLCKPSNLAG